MPKGRSLQPVHEPVHGDQYSKAHVHPQQADQHQDPKPRLDDTRPDQCKHPDCSADECRNSACHNE